MNILVLLLGTFISDQGRMHGAQFQEFVDQSATSQAHEAYLGNGGNMYEIQRCMNQAMNNAGGGWKKVGGCDFQIGNTSSSSSNNDDVLSSPRALLPSPCAHLHLSKSHSLAQSSFLLSLSLSLVCC